MGLLCCQHRVFPGEHWARIELLLPSITDKIARSFEIDRWMVEGIVCHYGGGIAWFDSPRDYVGTYLAVWKLCHYAAKGIWGSVLAQWLFDAKAAGFLE